MRLPSTALSSCAFSHHKPAKKTTKMSCRFVWCTCASACSSRTEKWKQGATPAKRGCLWKPGGGQRGWVLPRLVAVRAEGCCRRHRRRRVTPPVAPARLLLLLLHRPSCWAFSGAPPTISAGASVSPRESSGVGPLRSWYWDLNKHIHTHRGGDDKCPLCPEEEEEEKKK